MLYLGLKKRYIFAALTATVKAGEFLQPWTYGSRKDYSDNVNYAVGVKIITEWEADFSNATVTLNQDNNPGDAQGGPSVGLEVSYNQTTWNWMVSYEGMDPTYNNVFYFSVSQADGSDSFNGHYFNISQASTSSSAPAAARSTGGSSSTILLSSSSSSSSTTTTTSQSWETRPSQSASSATITIAPSSGVRTPVGTIAGIVVATVVGALLLVGGAWWAYKIQKKRRDSNSSTTSRIQQPTKVASSGQPMLYFHREQGPYGASNGNQSHVLYESDGRPIYELHEPVVGQQSS